MGHQFITMHPMGQMVREFIVKLDLYMMIYSVEQIDLSLVL